jgi:phage baseplate assembly protein gpV
MTYKAGVVESVEGANAVVVFSDLDGMKTKPIPVGQSFTGKDKAFLMPKPGDHVACVMDDHFEDGFVSHSIYSDAEPPPVTGDRIHFALEGGAVFDFDASTQAVTITLGGCTVKLSSAGIDVTGGDIKTDHDMLAGTVSLRHHLTKKVQPGTGLSDEPLA